MSPYLESVYEIRCFTPCWESCVLRWKLIVNFLGSMRILNTAEMYDIMMI
jgi:hypothetical protein